MPIRVLVVDDSAYPPPHPLARSSSPTPRSPGGPRRQRGRHPEASSRSSRCRHLRSGDCRHGLVHLPALAHRTFPPPCWSSRRTRGTRASSRALELGAATSVVKPRELRLGAAPSNRARGSRQIHQIARCPPDRLAARSAAPAQKISAPFRTAAPGGRQIRCVAIGPPPEGRPRSSRSSWRSRRATRGILISQHIRRVSPSCSRTGSIASCLPRQGGRRAGEIAPVWPRGPRGSTWSWRGADGKVLAVARGGAGERPLHPSVDG